MRLYRVIPYDRAALIGAPGHPLFIPPATKLNRLDSPNGHYKVFYAAGAPESAIAEAFGVYDPWDAALFESVPASIVVPNSFWALGIYDIDVTRLDVGAVRNLDDASYLSRIGLRPSQVVTRSRDVTQAWAEKIYTSEDVSGVAWWSYYCPEWLVYGIWKPESLRIIGSPRRLTLSDCDVITAARSIVRSIV